MENIGLKKPNSASGKPAVSGASLEKIHMPQFAAEVSDTSFGLRGYVVVDMTIDGHACGGLRLTMDVDRDHIASLARGMTLKYGFSGMAQGGAKAGIVGDPDMPSEVKRTLLRRFGELIGPMLKSGYYISGPDMNVAHEDIDELLAGAGLTVPRGRRRKGKKSGLFTAMGVMVAIEAAASEKKIDLSKSRIAIEGYGSVGSALGWLITHNFGATVVAVSTTKGALYNRQGLDVNKMMDLRERYGNEFVLHYDGAERIDLEDIFLLDVEVLSPCARQFSITAENAPRIAAPLVVPGANTPVTAEADEILHQRGILSVPYFAANCGGVIGNRMEVLGVSDVYIEGYLRAHNVPRIKQLIQRSAASNIPPEILAEEYALRRFAETKKNAEEYEGVSRWYAAGLQVVRHGWVPEGMLRLMAPMYFERGAERDLSIERYLPQDVSL